MIGENRAGTCWHEVAVLIEGESPAEFPWNQVWPGWLIGLEDGR